MGLAAGSLNRRLTIQRATTGDDGLQTTTIGWDDLVTVWAGKKDLSDGERSRAQGSFASGSTRFVIRYSSDVADVNPKDRCVCEGVTYDIIGVKELERRVSLEITAARRAD